MYIYLYIYRVNICDGFCSVSQMSVTCLFEHLGPILGWLASVDLLIWLLNDALNL